MRKFSQKLLATILSAALLVSSMLCMPLTALAEDTAPEATSTVVLSDGFEDSAEAWTGATFVTDNVRNGSNALQLGNTDGAITYRTFEVEANTDYFVSLYTKNGGKIGKYWGIKPYAVDDEGVVDTDLSAGTVARNDFATNTSWFGAQNLFNSGENTTLTLIFEGAADAVFYVDDIEIRKVVADKEDNLIKNGNFENGLMNWQERYHSPALLSRLTAGGSDGEYSAQPDTNYAFLSQRFAVKPNTTYVLKYSYMETSATHYEAMAVITPTVIGANNGWNDSAAIYKKTVAPATNDIWNTETVSFNSGDNTALTFGFRNLSSNKESIYLDDVQIYEAGLVVNGGLEYGKLGWGGSYNGMDTLDDQYISSTEVKNGSYSATVTGYSYLSTVFDAEANTDYIISFWVKSTGTMQFRLSDGATANVGWNSVTAVEGMGETVISAKSDWTKQTICFNSGDITTGKIGVIFRGATSNGTIYVDDVEVIKNPYSDKLLLNGDLEAGNYGYKLSENWGGRYSGNGGLDGLGLIASNEAYSGDYSVKGTQGYGYVATYFTPEADTYYTVTFYAKGGWTEACAWNGTYASVALPNKTEALVSYGFGGSEWQKFTFTFWSGDAETVTLSFRATTSTDIYIDDVVTEKSTIEQIPAGDLDIDGTIASAIDIATLRKLLIGVITEADIAGKANVNGTDGIDIRDLVALKKLAIS